MKNLKVFSAIVDNGGDDLKKVIKASYGMNAFKEAIAKEGGEACKVKDITPELDGMLIMESLEDTEMTTAEKELLAALINEHNSTLKPAVADDDVTAE